MTSDQRIYTEAYASLRFVAKNLDPLDVTLILRLPPDETHRAGEPRLSRSKAGEVIETELYQNGMWLMSSKEWVRSPCLSIHVEWILGQLEHKVDSLRAILAKGVYADIFCYSRGRADTPPLIPRQLRQCAEAFGLSIEIDHYVDGGVDAE